jgi:hypothetical protein
VYSEQKRHIRRRNVKKARNAYLQLISSESATSNSHRHSAIRLLLRPLQTALPRSTDSHNARGTSRPCVAPPGSKKTRLVWAEGMHEGRTSLGDEVSGQRRGCGRGREKDSSIPRTRAWGEGGTRAQVKSPHQRPHRLRGSARMLDVGEQAKGFVAGKAAVAAGAGRGGAGRGGGKDRGGATESSLKAMRTRNGGRTRPAIARRYSFARPLSFYRHATKRPMPRERRRASDLRNRGVAARSPDGSACGVMGCDRPRAAPSLHTGGRSRANQVGAYWRWLNRLEKCFWTGAEPGVVVWYRSSRAKLG